MTVIRAMQKSGVIVYATGQDIPQRVLGEPVSVPWPAIVENSQRDGVPL